MKKKHLIRALALLLALISVAGSAVACSSGLPTIFSYEDYGVRFDDSTDFDNVDPKYIEQVKDNLKLILVGTEELNDTDNEIIAATIKSIDSAANSALSTMVKNIDANTTALWDDGVSWIHDDTKVTLNQIMNNFVEAKMTAQFGKIYNIARAYCTPGSNYYQSKKIKTQLLNALDFQMRQVYNYYMDLYMYANSAYQKEYAGDPEYGPQKGVTSRTPWGGNWWEWDIGSPSFFLDTILLLEDELTQEQIDEYLRCFDRANYMPSMTIANRADIEREILVSALLHGDAKRVYDSLKATEEVFDYVDLDKVKSGELTGDAKDGFYEDGSFIQHDVHPYAAGYGMSMLGSLTEIILATSGTAFELPTECVERQISWIYDSFEPVCYNGAMSSTVAGRGVSRNINETNRCDGIYKALIKLSAYSCISSEDKERLLSIAKLWYDLAGESGSSLVSGLPIYMVKYAQKAMKKSKPRTGYVLAKVFPQMDRMVVHGEKYGAAIAMSSNRIAKYESINNENMNGWYLGDGALYIYSDDRDQFGKTFWTNLDRMLVPGTTVTTAYRKVNNAGTTFNATDYAGGVSVGKYGAAAMQLMPFTSRVKEESFSSTLTAKKAYFFFDNEVVVLGTDINCTDKNDSSVITVVENRLLDKADIFKLNGKAKSLTTSWEIAEGTNYIYSSALGGYYFPDKADVNCRIVKDKATFLQMTVTHGKSTSTSDGDYSIVYLPNMTEKQVDAYVKAPEIEILANDSTVQAVSDSSSGSAAYIFWKAGSCGDVEVDSLCEVMTVKEGKNGLKVAISDPTQKLDSVTVTVKLPSSGLTVKSSSDNVTASVSGDTATITVDTSKHYGWSYEVVFGK